MKRERLTAANYHSLEMNNRYWSASLLKEFLDCPARAIAVQCDVCGGKRYKEATLEVKYKERISAKCLICRSVRPTNSSRLILR